MHDGAVTRNLQFPGTLTEFTSCLDRIFVVNGGIQLDYYQCGESSERQWRLECADTTLVVSSVHQGSSHSRSWRIEVQEEVYRYVRELEVNDNPAAILEIAHGALIDVRQRSSQCLVSFLDGRATVSPYDPHLLRPLGTALDCLIDMIAEGIDAWKSYRPYIGTDDPARRDSEVINLESQASFGAKRRRRADLFKELKGRYPNLSQSDLAQQAEQVARNRIRTAVEDENPQMKQGTVDMVAAKRWEDEYGDLKWNTTAVENDWKDMRKAGEVTDYKEYGTSRE